MIWPNIGQLLQPGLILSEHKRHPVDLTFGACSGSRREFRSFGCGESGTCHARSLMARTMSDPSLYEILTFDQIASRVTQVPVS